MSYRDPEFCESLDGFVDVSSLDTTHKLPKEKVCRLLFCMALSRADFVRKQRMRVAIIQ